MIDPGRPVRVFRNWKRGCYSIMQGTFIVSAREVELTDVEFRVRESGRLRMLRTGRKNVHAYAVGTLAGFSPVTGDHCLASGFSGGRALTYDAVEAGHFLDRDSRAPVLGADRAKFDDQGARYLPRTSDLPIAA